MTAVLKYQARGITRGPLASHGDVPSPKTKVFYSSTRTDALNAAFNGITEDEVRVAAWDSSHTGYREYNVVFKLDGQRYAQSANPTYNQAAPFPA
jgi:hypothetical protein